MFDSHQRTGQAFSSPVHCLSLIDFLGNTISKDPLRRGPWLLPPRSSGAFRNFRHCVQILENYTFEKKLIRRISARGRFLRGSSVVALLFWSWCVLMRFRYVFVVFLIWFVCFQESQPANWHHQQITRLHPCCGACAVNRVIILDLLYILF